MVEVQLKHNIWLQNIGTLDRHKPRDGMRAISLATDASFITAWSMILVTKGFLRQLQTLAKLVILCLHIQLVGIVSMFVCSGICNEK